MKKINISILTLFLFNCSESQLKQRTIEENKQMIVLKNVQNEINMKINTQNNTAVFSPLAIADLPLTEYFIPITRYFFIMPAKYTEPYKYESNSNMIKGSHTDAIGEMEVILEHDSNKLPINYRIIYPDGNSRDLKFIYNGYYLLKIVDDKFIDKILLENKYDDKGRLMSQEKNNEELKSMRSFFYNDRNQIIKEIIKENDADYNLLYEYNSKGELIKKYSEDKNHIYEYTYDEKGKLIKELEYIASINKQKPDEIQNNFTENILEYDGKGNLIKEINKKIPYTNTSILVNGKWKTISLEEQKKYAWQEYRKRSEFFFWYITTKNYTYLGDNLVSAYEREIRNDKDEKNTHSETLISEQITKYIYNNLGQIVKKETMIGTDKKPSNVQEYSY